MDIVDMVNFMIMALLLVAGCVYLWKLYQDWENDFKCPKCGERWAGENVEEKLLGIFQRGTSAQRPFSIRAMFVREMDVKMVWYEKYEIQRRCKFCGHEWKVIRSIKQ